MADTRPDSPVAILGGGITGLAAALGLARLGIASTVVERHVLPGGLARVECRQGLRMHLGVHLIHPSSDDLRPTVNDIERLIGGGLHRVMPRAAIHYRGRLIDYPFRTWQVASALGPLATAGVCLAALRGRLETMVAGDTMEDDRQSFEQVIERAFGRRFYRLFFREYTAKVLGLAPKLVSGDWARKRIPMPGRTSLLQVLLPWWRPARVEHAHSPLHPTQTTADRGMQALFDGMLREGGRLVTLLPGHRFERLQETTGGWRLLLREGHGRPVSLRAAAVISTIPLPALITGLDPPAPAAVKQSAGRLTPRGIVFVFLLLRQPRLFRHHWIYFQHPGLMFNRVSEFSNLVPGTYGDGMTLVCAEVTADPEQPVWQAADESIVRRVVHDLEVVTGQRLSGRVETSAITREADAYPCWRTGFRDDLNAVLVHLAARGRLYTAGRQGRFDYLNLDECFRQGITEAQHAAGDHG